MNKPLKTLKTHAFSLQVAWQSGARPNSCFSNAWNALINLPQWFHQSFYVEGWIVLETNAEILLIEHGWCMLPDNQVVDPTLVLSIGPDDSVVYFSGIQYTWSETLAFEHELLPRVRETHGNDGMEHDDYKAAYNDALEIATTLSTAYEPPKKMSIHIALPEEEMDCHRPDDTGHCLHHSAQSLNDLFFIPLMKSSTGPAWQHC